MPPALREIARNSVKEKLARGEVVASMTVRLVPTVEIVRIAMAACTQKAKQVKDIKL